MTYNISKTNDAKSLRNTDNSEVRLSIFSIPNGINYINLIL